MKQLEFVRIIASYLVQGNFMFMANVEGKRTYSTITERDNVFLSIICIIEVFEMMATLAIDGLDSNEIAGCKMKGERGRVREEKK